MLRLTVKETAHFLDRRPSWVYNTLRSLGCESVTNFLSLDEIYSLFKFSFKAKSYDKYMYDNLVDHKFVKLVQVGSVVDLKKSIKNAQDFYEILIALKYIKQTATMFNIVSYISKKLSIKESWREGFKDYIYKKSCHRFVKFFDNKILFLPAGNGNGDVNQEVLNSLTDKIKTDVASA